MERLNANTPPRTPTNQNTTQRNSPPPVIRQQQVAQDAPYRTPINQGISDRGNQLPIRTQTGTQATAYLTVAPDNNVTPIDRTSAVPRFMPMFTPETETQNAQEQNVQEQNERATRVPTEATRQSFQIADDFNQPSSLPPRS